MTNIEILVLAIALSLDAMLVSFSYGLLLEKRKIYNSVLLSSSFGFFQFFMPLIGALLTGFLYSQLEAYSKWIVFVVFMFLGLKFLKSVFSKTDEVKISCITFMCLIFLSVATSVDALGAGVTLRLLHVNEILVSFVIGIVTFVLSFIGFCIANFFKRLPSRLIEIIGAFLLIYLAIKAIL